MTSGLRDRELWLLTACFARGRGAIECYRRWREATDLNGPISPDTYRLLPQLYLRLQSEKYEDDFSDRLKGVYRRAWYVTHRQLQAAEEVLGMSASVDVDAILIHGSALVADAAADSRGLRPLHYSSLLVSPKDALRLIRRVCGMGWTRTSRLPESVRDQYFEIMSWHRLVHPEGGVLRLNTSLVRGYGGPRFSEVRNGGVRRDLLTVPSLLPSAEHQLIGLCAPSDPVEGRSLGASAADVLTVCSNNSVDWDALVFLSRQARVCGSLRPILELAAAIAPELCPEYALHRLSMEKPSRIEAVEQRLSGGAGLLNKAAKALLGYARLRQTDMPIRMREYIAYRLGVSSPSSVPGLIWNRLSSRVTDRRRESTPIPIPRDAA